MPTHICEGGWGVGGGECCKAALLSQLNALSRWSQVLLGICSAVSQQMPTRMQMHRNVVRGEVRGDLAVGA